MATENQDTVVQEGLFTMADIFGAANVETPAEPQTIEEKITGEITPAATQEPEVTEPVETTTVEPTLQQVNTNPDAYLEFIREAIEDGDYEDVMLELEDGTQVELSKLDKVDKRLFQEIKKAQKQLQAEKIKEKYISAEGLDDTTKRLVELKRAGEDISELIQSQIDLKDPLDGLDLEDPQVQKWLMFEEYKAKGIDPEIAIAQIEKLDKEFKLDVESKKVADTIKKSIHLAQESKLAAKEQELLTKNEQQKEYRKNLNEYYKGLNLNDAKIRTLVDNATKSDQAGKTNFDKLLDEVKKDPAKMAEINFYLNDEKGFLDFKTAKVKTETNLKFVKIVHTGAKPDKHSPAGEQDTENPWEKKLAQTQT